MFKEKLSKITTRILYILFAVLVSVSLWLYVEITENELQTSPISGVQIILRNEEVLRDRGLLISSVVTEPLTFEIEGNRSDLSRLSVQGALTVEVDLSTITSAGTVALMYDINFPVGVSRNDVELKSWSDSRVTVIVDRILTREIPVRVTYTGGTASGELFAEAVRWEPLTINVQGPEQVVSRIQYARVPILRENLSTTYREDLTFILIAENGEVLDDSLLESVRYDQETIHVIVPIMQIKDVVLDVEFIHGSSTSAANTTWRIEPSEITVSGDPEAVGTLNTILLTPIDMTRFGLTSQITRPIRVPDHITNISGEIEATVHVDIVGLEIAFRSATNLFVRNVPTGYRAEIVTQSIDVRMRGASEDLALVTPNNIRIEADLTDMNPGTTRVNATVYIDGVTNIDPIGDYQIVVTITAEQQPPQ